MGVERRRHARSPAAAGEDLDARPRAHPSAQALRRASRRGRRLRARGRADAGDARPPRTRAAAPGDRLRVEDSITIDAPAAEVWERITDPLCYTRVMSHITRFDVEGERARGLGA